jgi:Sulfotransferase family
VDALDRESLRGWTPVRVAVRHPAIEWAIVDRPFTDPFFEQTAHVAMQHRFNQIFARRTPLDILDELGAEPVRAPAGLIVHMSRCGSTLITQMLARLPNVVVLSEPQPFDGLLRLRDRGHADADKTLVRRLRGLMRALAPDSDEPRVVVKLHAWHVLELSLLARACPQTPVVFVFREPRGVLRSQARNAGAEVLAGTIDPAYAGIRDAAELARPDYGARVLAAMCEAALRHAATGEMLFVDYETLPDAVFTRVLPFLGLPFSGADESVLREIARNHTKREGERFRPDAALVGPALDAQAARWLDAPYAALRALAGVSA